MVAATSAFWGGYENFDGPNRQRQQDFGFAAVPQSVDRWGGNRNAGRGRGSPRPSYGGAPARPSYGHGPHGRSRGRSNPAGPGVVPFPIINEGDGDGQTATVGHLNALEVRLLEAINNCAVRG